MDGLFTSSKSLLASVEKLKNKSDDSLGKKDESNTGNDGSFLLASTLPNVPKPIKEKTINSVDQPSAKLGENLEGDELDSESDSDSDKVEDNVKKPRINDSKTLQLLSVLNPSNLLKSHDLLLGSFYEEHQDILIAQKKLTVRVITWNLNQMKPPSLQTLATPRGREWATFFYSGDATISENNPYGLADIYTLNFQETISLTSFTKSNNAIDQWCDFLLAVLNGISSDSYSIVQKSGLLAITSIVIAKHYLFSSDLKGIDGQIHNLKEDTIGLGYLRWANKGCISLRFTIGGVDLRIPKNINDSSSETLDDTAGKLPGIQVQILNVHLVHGENDAQIQQRKESWAKIERKIGLNDRTVKLVSNVTSFDIKDAAQKRLEEKIQKRLNKKGVIENKMADSIALQMEDLGLGDDSVRTALFPLNFQDSELGKIKAMQINDEAIVQFRKVTEAKKVVIVCGDTNYRLSVPIDQNKNAIEKLIADGCWDDLLKYDQLKNELQSGKVLVGFKEEDIHFAPTFKIINDSVGEWIMTPPVSASSETKPFKKGERRAVPSNTDKKEDSNLDPYYLPKYDSKRLPAYTDRILYVPRPHIKFAEGTYSSIFNRGSDHLPVASSYKLDVPIVDEGFLHKLKNSFTTAWDEVINKLIFFTTAMEVSIEHKVENAFAIQGTHNNKASVIETVQIDGGNIAFSAIAGESLTISIGIQNIIEESFNLSVKEHTSRGWFGTKIHLSCQQVGESNKTPLPTCKIDSHNSGEIIFSLIPTSSGLLERTFIAEIPEYSICPASRKYIALTIKVEDIFGTSFENISTKQFSNIEQCFKFVFNGPSGGLLARAEELSSLKDLKPCEWNLVREVSLWSFSADKYAKMNDEGIDAVKNGERDKFNLGSVSIMSFLYVWLKSQDSNFTTGTPRGKIIFSNVIKLIKYFNMDANRAYNWFGWLFADEYELERYLDQDFDVKLVL